MCAPGSANCHVTVGPEASLNRPSPLRSQRSAAIVPSASTAVELNVIGWPAIGTPGSTTKPATGGSFVAGGGVAGGAGSGAGAAGGGVTATSWETLADSP